MLGQKDGNRNFIEFENSTFRYEFYLKNIQAKDILFKHISLYKKSGLNVQFKDLFKTDSK